MFSSAKTWMVRKSGLDYAPIPKPFEDDSAWSEHEHEHEHERETTTSPAWNKNQAKRQSTQSTKSTQSQSSLENYRGFLTERSNSLYDTPEQHNYFYDTVGERAAAGYYQA